MGLRQPSILGLMNKQEAWAYLNSLRYIPCRDQFDLAKTPRDWVIMHEMVSPERHDMAESLGNYFVDPRNSDGSLRYASTHFGSDDDSNVRYARYYTKVYGTEGQGNTRGWHIEQAGSGVQTGTEWFDGFSKKMIDEQSSKLCAALCVVDDIPMVHVTPTELRQGKRGITTHYEMCQAFMQGMQNQWHYDPKNFPMDYFIDQVKRHAGVTPQPNPDTEEQELMAAKDDIIAAFKAEIKALSEKTDKNDTDTRRWMGSRPVKVVNDPAQFLISTDATGKLVRVPLTGQIKSVLVKSRFLSDIGKELSADFVELTDAAEVAAFLALPVV